MDSDLLVYIVTVYVFNTLGDIEYGEHEVTMWEEIPSATTIVLMTKFDAFVAARKLANANPRERVVIRECVVGQDDQIRSWSNYPDSDKFLRETVVDSYGANGEPREIPGQEDKTALVYTD